MVATDVFFAGAFFLVTPAGFAPLVVVDFFGPLFAPVLAVARFLVVVVVVSVTVGKILGLELPNTFGSAEPGQITRAANTQAGNSNCQSNEILTCRRAGTFTSHCIL